MSAMAIELQDIFREHIEEYLNKHEVTPVQLNAINAILNCRTAALGGRVEGCSECGHTVIVYNSCRNRHCPKCQTLAKEKWIDARIENLLPVPYFHVVFTIPKEIRMLVYQNQEELYRVFFSAVAETLSTLGADPKHLGAQIGFISILHTWGQNLTYHPHIHCIVPNGGLTEEGSFKQGSEKFFLPVKVISRLFRGKFLDKLNKAFSEGTLDFHSELKHLKNQQLFYRLLKSLYEKEWVVYTRKTFSGPTAVIQYLGRYTHRVAISNNRILKLENGCVTFKWRDYRDNKEKIMTLPVEEFIRRFLMHVLPHGFMKIRHYGLQANCNVGTKLRLCQRLLKYEASKSKFKSLSAVEIIKVLTGKDVTLCPHCQKGKLVPLQRLWVGGPSPPISA